MILLVVWVVCGVLAYGMMKHLQKYFLLKGDNFSWSEMECINVFVASLGPIGLLSVSMANLMFVNAKDGWNIFGLCYVMPEGIYDRKEKE